MPVKLRRQRGRAASRPASDAAGTRARRRPVACHAARPGDRHGERGPRVASTLNASGRQLCRRVDGRELQQCSHACAARGGARQDLDPARHGAATPRRWRAACVAAARTIANRMATASGSAPLSRGAPIAEMIDAAEGVLEASAGIEPAYAGLSPLADPDIQVLTRLATEIDRETRSRRLRHVARAPLDAAWAGSASVRCARDAATPRHSRGSWRPVSLAHAVQLIKTFRDALTTGPAGHRNACYISLAYLTELP